MNTSFYRVATPLATVTPIGQALSNSTSLRAQMPAPLALNTGIPIATSPVRFVGRGPYDSISGQFNRPLSEGYPLFTNQRNTTHPELVGLSGRNIPSFVTPFQSVLNAPLTGINFNKPYQQLTRPNVFGTQLAGLNNPQLGIQNLRNLFPTTIQLSGLNPYKEPTGPLAGLIPYQTPDHKAGLNLTALDYLNFAEKFQTNVYPAFRVGDFLRPYTGGV